MNLRHFASIAFGSLALAACGGPIESQSSNSAADLGSMTGGFMSFGGRYGLNKCLNVWSSPPAAGSQLDSTDCGGGDYATEYFTLYDTGEIKPNGYPNLCVEVRNADYGTGYVQVYDCNATAAQQWVVAEGQIQARYAPSASCLTVHGGNTANAAVVDLEPCNNSQDQLWWAFGFTSNVTSHIGYDSMGSYTFQCLDVWYDQTNAGATLDNTQCNDTDGQGFTFSVNHEIKHDGLCLDVKGANVSAGVVTMQPCNGTNAQKWAVSRDVNGWLIVISALRGANNALECVDINGANSTPGTRVDLAGCNNTVAQIWHPFVAGFPSDGYSY
jgi:hypothetical protein